MLMSGTEQDGDKTWTRVKSQQENEAETETENAGKTFVAPDLPKTEGTDDERKDGERQGRCDAGSRVALASFGCLWRPENRKIGQSGGGRGQLLPNRQLSSSNWQHRLQGFRDIGLAWLTRMQLSGVARSSCGAGFSALWLPVADDAGVAIGRWNAPPKVH